MGSHGLADVAAATLSGKGYSMSEQAFALFDFDGTMAKGDSLVPFLLYALQKGFAPKRTIFPVAAALTGYMLRITSAAEAKGKAISFLKGKTAQEVDAFCTAFYKERLQLRIYPKARAEIADLRSRGFTVLVVTASPAFYLDGLKRDLGVDDIIGTRVDLDESGIYSGRLSGDNCRGLEKPLRIAEYLAAKGLLLDKDNSVAYGDSANDFPMLSLVSRPVIVNGKGKLPTLCPNARRESWRL